MEFQDIKLIYIGFILFIAILCILIQICDMFDCCNCISCNFKCKKNKINVTQSNSIP